MKIEIGKYSVYSNGTVIGLLNETIRFFIEDLVFELKFINDEENPSLSVDAISFENNKGITLVFKNFNNSLGTGNIIPIPLGTVRGKQILFNYRIYALDNSSSKGEPSKTVHYTWLIEK